MPDEKIPEKCPSCGLDGSIRIEEGEYVCGDENCGRAFPINPKVGPAGKDKGKDK